MDTMSKTPTRSVRSGLRWNLKVVQTIPNPAPGAPPTGYLFLWQTTILPDCMHVQPLLALRAAGSGLFDFNSKALFLHGKQPWARCPALLFDYLMKTK